MRVDTDEELLYRKTLMRKLCKLDRLCFICLIRGGPRWGENYRGDRWPKRSWKRYRKQQWK